MTREEALKVLERDLAIQKEHKCMPDGIIAVEIAIRALKKYDEIVRIINAPIYIQEDVFRYKAICAVVGDETDSVRPDYMPLIEKEGGERECR